MKGLALEGGPRWLAFHRVFLILCEEQAEVGIERVLAKIRFALRTSWGQIAPYIGPLLFQDPCYLWGPPQFETECEVEGKNESMCVCACVCTLMNACVRV